MTENEWLKCTHPDKMLRHLAGKVSERQLRLLACAACRRLWRMLRDERSRKAVEVSERYADGLADEAELRAAAAAARLAEVAARAANGFWNAAWTAAETAGKAEAAAQRAVQAAADADLFREIFGNPFRPLQLDPSWLRWNHGSLLTIARSIYEERRFGDLPILADALIDAGCQDEEVLAHCRSPYRHVRGCWVVDGILKTQLDD
jgi:hypothetical protein